MQKQWENDPRIIIYKKIFKVSAVLIVFIVSFSLPIIIINRIHDDAKSLRIKTGINQTRLWAEVHRLQEGNFKELEEREEIKMVIADIKNYDGEMKIFVSSDCKKYCIESGLINKIEDNWCSDDSGFIGKGFCSKESTRCK